MKSQSQSALLIALATLLAALPVVAQTTQPVGNTPDPLSSASSTVDVWPAGKMPGVPATQPETRRSPERTDATRITNVSNPTLSVFPAKGKDAAPAIIVCPGGGYGYVVIDKEGTEIAAWLNTNGITAVVLKYRVPDNRPGALQDIQRAIRVARANATAWNIDPKRLGVIGFSAGGHLAARASTQFDAPSYPPIDAADEQSSRPDFAVLVYPAYLYKGGKVTRDLNLQAKIPPTLIVHNEDDVKYVPGSKIYHEALDEAKVTNELKMYATGGHGYALRSEKAVKAWPQDALEWLKSIGVK